DSYVDLARIGARRPGNACILMGSTLVVEQVVEAGFSGPMDLGLRAMRSPGEGLAVGGWTSSAGMALRWCAGVLGLPPSEPPAEAAALVPGAGGLLALPYFA